MAGETARLALAVLLLCGAPNASLAQQPTSTLSVRIVDPQRAPLPGITVRVGEVGNCTTPTRDSSRRSAVTRADGSVEFTVTRERAWLIMVESQGGLEAGHDCLERVGAGIAYSQIELRPDLSQQEILNQPSMEQSAPPRTLGLGDFVGVYTDEAGLFYEVTVLDGAAGVALSSPGGGILRFPNRRGSSFRGSDGTIRFRVARGRVEGFSVTRPVVQGQDGSISIETRSGSGPDESTGININNPVQGDHIMAHDGYGSLNAGVADAVSRSTAILAVKIDIAGGIVIVASADGSGFDYIKRK